MLEQWKIKLAHSPNFNLIDAFRIFDPMGNNAISGACIWAVLVVVMVVALVVGL